MIYFVIPIPFNFGKQIGLIFFVIGTRSFNRKRAMSLSKFRKLKAPATARNTNLDSGLLLSLHLSCSPNVTLIINHMNLKSKSVKTVTKSTPKKSFSGSLLCQSL